MTLTTINHDYPGATVLSNSPYVCVIDNFISPKLCNHIISLANPRIKPATVAKNSGREVSDGRTNQMTFLNHGLDSRVDSLVLKISKLIGLPKAHAESLQVINYQIGERYDPHLDTFDPYKEGEKVFVAKSGQRIATALFYLTDVEAGGATTFPNLFFDVLPKQGSMMIFQTCIDGTNMPAKKALHGSLPVVSGEKWAANLWFREQPYIG